MLVAIALVVTYFVTNNSSSSNPPPAGIASDVATSIPTDGAKLAAEVITPKGAGKAPLVVMPAPWGTNTAASYHAVATQFATSGYVVVAYNQRGFGKSTGKVDFAGSATQRDASSVITWALQHTKADRDHIGMFGISYGAGISLLTAAHDPRVKAVTALSTWTNIAGSFDADGVPHTAGLASLLASQNVVPHLDATTRQLRNTLLNAPATLGAELRALSPSRSPDSYVRELNHNRPAIMIANAYQDSLFDPAQLVPFFNALTTPKRLELEVGDHGSPELSGLAGQPNDTISSALDWLDHYLRGIPNGIDVQEPILLKDVRTGELRQFTSWPEPTKADVAPLGAPGTTTTRPGADASSKWTATLRAGVDSGAAAPSVQLVASSAYRLPHIAISQLKSNAAWIWNGPTIATGLALAGTPSVHLGLSSTTSTATIYVYLYDVTAAGDGTLVDVEPYTATGLQHTVPRQLNLDLQPIAYSVPAGDHLTLVIDTFDEKFQSLTPAGNTVTVTSSKAHPATFTAPAAP